MEKRKNFWDKNAGRYDRFMHKDAAAYEQLYELLRPVVRHKQVLELATGTGLIAKNIVNAAAHIEVADSTDNFQIFFRKSKVAVILLGKLVDRIFGVMVQPRH